MSDLDGCTVTYRMGEEGLVHFSSPVEIVSDQAFPVGQQMKILYGALGAGYIGQVQVIERHAVDGETF